ncbi:HlyD family type I secretion periplasmic adaptor subunit [Polaromonas eurypsychrophila]|uniref:Membrane fusion protein (MFP) family protein n=1 Tax=Polaromonas eurypsychrophila TaxID=1614635 RepID=A0A916WL74_9BURK|nr:HlyD family type I secretion periplasmic adaptor subunit [Polaromonas eurypsychrophila]GGB08749.1 HlyD family type I secretion periplasmic adaptor subunit [Polaromonas eurypsychrophila]
MSNLTQALTKRLLPDAAEFSPGLLAIQESPMPKLPRLIFYLVAVLFTILLGWAIFAKIDIVAVAEGKLVPISYTKIVQPAEAGVVSDILVKEGDQVQAGQVLIRLDPTMTGADSRSLASELTLKRLTLRRVDSELAGTPLAIKDGDEPAMITQVQAQANAHRQAFTDALAQEVATRERAQNELRAAQETLTKLKTTLPSYEQSAKAHSKLVAEGFLSPIAGNDKEREAIEKSQDLKAQAATVQGLLSTITAQDKKIAGLSSTFRSQLLIERTEAMGQLAKLEQDTQKMGYKTGLLELKAPQAGIVKDVATTSKGAVVQPGMVLLTLVPKGEQLLAEVQVKNEDVGFVQTGQQVRVKVAAYPFQKYGLIEGRIQTLAPDAQSNTTNNPGQAVPQGYKALVKLDTQFLESLNGDTSQRKGLEAGMQVAAEIHQGRRTIMEYLLSPVQKVSAEAGRER